MSNGYRTLSQHLNDLKKENFSLKLRIYFLEERIQQKYEESSEEVHRRNIELKVEVASLEQELLEKQQLLDKALTTAESLTSHNEAELQRRCEERQQEIDHMQEILETKIQLLQEEAKLAHSDAERTATQGESCCPSLGRTVEEPLEDMDREPPSSEKDREIEELTQALRDKEAMITELMAERTLLHSRVEDLSAALQQQEEDTGAIQGKLVEEKQHVQQEVQRLQEKLCEMESELQSTRRATQSQERTILELGGTVRVKESEAEELHCVINKQNEALCKLRQAADPNQLQQTSGNKVQPAPMSQAQTEILALQNSLFSTQMELQSSQRACRQAERQAQELVRSRDRLNADLQGALQQYGITEQHIKELRSALHQTRSDLQMKQKELRGKEVEAQVEVLELKKTIQQLRVSLQDKEQLVKEYSELTDGPQKSGAPRDALLNKLRERIKDRDRALERSIDEKFHCLEEKEGEVRQLHLSLREKDRDLGRLQCTLSNNEETIMTLSAVLQGKELELEQMSEAFRNLQWLKQEMEEQHQCSLREKQALIIQLQTSLDMRSQEAQDLTAVLLCKVSLGPSEAVEALRQRLQLRERLFQEVMSDRSRQIQEHQAEVQELLHIISARDQYIKDSAGRLGQVIAEHTAELQELRRQLASRTGDQLGERSHHQAELQCSWPSKELGDVGSGSQTVRLAMEEELQLVPRKEQEAQDLQRQLVEGSDLPLVERLTKERLELCVRVSKQDLEGTGRGPRQDSIGTDHQVVTEYSQLNKALRTEKNLYHRLSEIHSQGNSSEMMKALHAELGAIQALRGQLEDVLARTRDAALTLDKAVEVQPDFGGFSTEEEEEEEGSSEFTDSVEEEDMKLTARTLATTRDVQIPCKRLGKHGELGVCQHERQQFVGKKRGMDRDPGELKSLVEKAGVTSLSQIRNALRSLRPEGVKPKVTVGRATWREREKSETGGLSEEEDDEEEEGPCEELGTPIQGKRCVISSQPREEQGKRRCTRTCSLEHCPKPPSIQEVGPGEDKVGFWWHVEAGLRQEVQQLHSGLSLSRQESRERQERLMVSEATVQAQAEQLKDYRQLLTETSVQQDSKQVQVDLQDLGYETSGRSENEAERDDASSPEFDDLEINATAGDYGKCEDVASLQRLVGDQQAKLSRAHRAIRRLQLRLRSLSATSDYSSSLERPSRKVNWAFRASTTRPGPEPDEGWQSDGPSRHGKELQELVARVASLEARLKKSSVECKGVLDQDKAAARLGKYDTLIQAQARELSHLRQKMREAGVACLALARHLGDTTKAFEDLLRANDVDYHMGQSFRQQLGQGSTLLRRISTRISGRDRLELHEDKSGHELLALRLKKELQQKNEIIEALHTKLHNPDTPPSSHAPSETTDQSDRTSCMSDDQGSTNEDLELSSDVDVASEFTQEDHTDSHCHGGRPPQLSSVPSPTPNPASHGAQASKSCPSMPCTSQIPMESQAHTGLYSGSMLGYLPISQTYCHPDLLGPTGPWPFDPRSPLLGTGVFSLAEVHQELHTLQRQMGESFPLPHTKPLSGNPLASHSLPDPSSYIPLSYPAFHPLQIPDPEMSHASLLEGGAFWGKAGVLQSASPSRHGITSSGSSGYQSVSDGRLVEEHASEIRRLRQCLEDSIGTNQRLVERLAADGRKAGAPTNIYIQGPESFSHLSGENRVLKEENLGLRAQLQVNRDSFREAEQLREAVLSGRAWLKRAELEAGQWKEELGKLRAHCSEQALELQRMQEERRASQEHTNGLQHEVSLLQQQLSESHQLLHWLQFKPQGSGYDRRPRVDWTLAPCSAEVWEPQHVVGQADDFAALRQQVLEGKALACEMEAALLEVGSGETLGHSFKLNLLSNTRTLRQILEETSSLLRMFWRAALPDQRTSPQHDSKEQAMKEEIHELRLQVHGREELLRGAAERLRMTGHTQENMELFVLGQLSKTRDVLKKARINLEKNEFKISALTSSSPSLCPGKADVSRSHQNPGSDWGSVSPHTFDRARGATGHHPQCTTKRYSGDPALSGHLAASPRLFRPSPTSTQAPVSPHTLPFFRNPKGSFLVPGP